MTNDEIEKAVENLKQCIVENYKDTPVKFSTVDSRDIHTLLTLAEEYLKVEGWPEERKPTNFQGKHYSNPTDEEFNSALRLCKLAAMKEKNEVSRKVIMQTLKSQDVYLPEHYEDLTTTLLKLINGKEKER